MTPIALPPFRLRLICHHFRRTLLRTILRAGRAGSRDTNFLYYKPLRRYIQYLCPARIPIWTQLAILVGGLALWPAGAAANDNPSPESFRTGHPRLLLSDSELSALITAAKTDPLRAALHARIIAAAELELSAPPLVYKVVGPRLLAQSMAAIDHILTCSMAYRLTGDRRFAERAKSDMLTAAAFPDWHPSHFLDVAEMALGVAVGYDWLYSYLDPRERTIIRDALVNDALSFAPAAYGPDPGRDPRLFWVRIATNWNQVCNSGLATAALALAEEEPELTRTVVAGVRSSLPAALVTYQPDGAYPEGPSYWAYGTTFTVVLLAELEGCAGTDFGL